MTYEIVKSMEDILQDEGLLSEIVMVMLWPTKPHSGNVKLLVGFFSSKNKKHFITLWCEVWSYTYWQTKKYSGHITTALLANAFTLLNNIFTFIDKKKFT